MKAYDLLLLFPQKKWAWFWVWLMLAQFRPKYDLKREIFNSFTNFFWELQYYSISYKYNNFLTYLNRNQPKKNPRWVELKVKFDQILSQSKPCICDLTSPRENWMVNIQNFQGAIQSNNVIFAGFKHVKIWQVFFIYLFI